MIIPSDEGVVIPQAVAFSTSLPYSSRLLHGLMCRWADEDGSFAMMQAEMASQFGVTERGISKMVMSLEKAGLVTLEGGRPYTYHVRLRPTKSG